MNHLVLAAAMLASAAPSPPAPDEAHQIADRLAQDLVCMCGECDRLPLAACTCKSAAREREQLLHDVSALDLSTEKARDHAYRAVRASYLARFGKDAEVYRPTVPTRWVYFTLLGLMTVAGIVLLLLPRKRIAHRQRRRRR